MSISRPFLLALLGAALLGATFFAVQNARDDSADPVAPAAQQAAPEQAATPAEPAEPVELTAEEALRAVTAPGERVASGRFELNYDFREIGGGREHDFTEISGSFECGCKGDVPKFDLALKSHSEDGYKDPGKDDEFHLLSTGDEGFVSADGDTAYRIDETKLKNVATLRSAVAGGGLANAPDFDLSRWVRDAKVVGTEELDGVETTHVTGQVSARKAAADVVGLLKADQDRSQVDVPPGAIKLAERAVTRARVDVWVGSDRVLRRMELQIRGDQIPRQLLEANDSPRGVLRLSLALSEVNDPQQIEAPAQVSDETPAKGMGAESAESAENNLVAGALVLNSPAGVAGTTALFLRLANQADEGDVAEKAARSVKAGKKVVILFQNPNGLDDRAMTRVVKTLDRRTGAVVLTDDVDAVDRYGKLVEDLGVSQTPSVVLVDRAGKARLIEGYVDTDTLTQAVADAR